MDDGVKAQVQPQLEQTLENNTITTRGQGVPDNSDPPYSCFSKRQKAYISYIASFSAIFSGL